MNQSQINIFIRNLLINHSGLKKNMVRNALSQYGSFLNKDKSKSIFETLEQSDLLILFETSLASVNSNISFDDNDKIKAFQSYNVHIIIYGETSEFLARKLCAKFKSSLIREEFERNNLYFIRTTSPQSVNEYSEDALWYRTDFDLLLTTWDFFENDSDYEINNARLEKIYVMRG